ncbi:MAG: hypothetical protein KAI83_10910 [Thiomargarita sp.]|nr:hypothetical protein [Thiomargarita sp.]
MIELYEFYPQRSQVFGNVGAEVVWWATTLPTLHGSLYKYTMTYAQVLMMRF